MGSPLRIVPRRRRRLVAILMGAAFGAGGVPSGRSTCPEPFEQRVCASGELERRRTTAQLTATWCEGASPFVLPRPFDAGASTGDPACVARSLNASGHSLPNDPCEVLTALATAELQANCSEAKLSAGTRGVLCDGNAERGSGSVSLQLVGTSDGLLAIIDAASQRIAALEVRVLPPGRPVRTLEAVSLAGASTTTRRRTRSENASADEAEQRMATVGSAVVVLAGDAATLQAYVLHATRTRTRSSSGNGDGGGVGSGNRSWWVRAGRCADGSDTLELASEGMALRSLGVASRVSGGWADDGAALAALLLERVDGSGGASGGVVEHVVRLYALRLGWSQCGLPATFERVGREIPVASDRTMLPVRMQLLGAAPSAHPIGGSGGAGQQGGGSAAAVAARGFRAVVGLSSEDGGVGSRAPRSGAIGGTAADEAYTACDWWSEAMVLLHDRLSVHLFRPCSMHEGGRVDLRAAELPRSRSVAHVAERGVELTAATGFFEHFARPTPTRNGAVVAAAASAACVTRRASVLGACNDVSGCDEREVEAAFCAAPSSGSSAAGNAASCADGAAEPEAEGGNASRSGRRPTDDGSVVAGLWLAVAKVSEGQSVGSAHSSPGVLQLVHMPEIVHRVGGDGDDSEAPEAEGLSGAALPSARCGLPSHDTSFHVNWYWARWERRSHLQAEAGAAEGSATSWGLRCEARQTYSVALAARAVEVVARFRGLAQLTPSLVGGALSSAATAPCELLLQVPALGWLHEACVSHSAELTGDGAPSPDRGGDEADDSPGGGGWAGRGAAASMTESQRIALRAALHQALFVRLAASVPPHEEGGGVGGSSSRVLVLGVQERLFSASGMVVERLNEMVVPGEGTAMHVSSNGQHVWLAVRRQRWEIESLQRAAELCALWRKRPEDPFLSRMGGAKLCGVGDSVSAGVRDAEAGARGEEGSDRARGDALVRSLFGWEATSCPPGALCPSFMSEQVYPSMLIAPGLYVERAYTFARCPAGSFCLGGVRVLCPPGYECPAAGLAAPVRCTWEGGDVDAATTCFNEASQSGVRAPEPCAPGRICVVPYAPGLPVPPGYFRRVGSLAQRNGGNRSVETSARKRGVERCQPGEWCPLGRWGDRSGAANDELQCPAATYCSRQDVAVPVVCNFSVVSPLFCPAGSVHASACPAGFHCSRTCPAIELGALCCVG